MTVEYSIVDPDVDLSLQPAAIQKAIEEMLAFVESAEVVDNLSFQRITALYSTARSWMNAIETKRKEAIEPSRAIVSAINNRAKQLTDPLSQIIAVANEKAAGWTRQIQKQRHQEAERLALMADLFDATPDLPIQTSATVQGAGANVTTRSIKKFRVADRSQIPSKYLMVNEDLINRDIKLGVSNIPGIEIYEDKIVTLRKN